VSKLAKTRLSCYRLLVAASIHRAALIIGWSVFAACAAPSSTPSFESVAARVGAPAPPSSVSSAAYEYVTDGQAPDVFRCHGQVCNTCKTLGGGLKAVHTGPGTPDAGLSGIVYVVDQAAHRIVGLDSSCSTILTLEDAREDPLDVDVGPHGMIAVTNTSTASSRPGNIAFYASGAKNPTRVAKGLLVNYNFGAFDKFGNFYNDGFAASGGPAVGVVPAGSKVNRAAGILGIGNPGGIEVAQNGTINIDDQACACIKIFKGKSKVGTVTLVGAVDPVTFAFNKENTRVWVADQSTGTVKAYPYPAGGEPLIRLKGFTSAVGVGVLPAAEP
jgi:hypothetical protein